MHQKRPLMDIDVVIINPDIAPHNTHNTELDIESSVSVSCHTRPISQTMLFAISSVPYLNTKLRGQQFNTS